MKQALAALALVVVLAGSARAEPDARTLAEAAERFDRGVRFFQAGDFAAALAELEAAHRLSGHFEALYDIGVTQSRLYRYHDAVGTLSRYLAEGGAAIEPARRAAVEAEITSIRASTAEVQVVVAGAPANIELDGLSVGRTPLAPLLVAPGRHLLRASRAGQRADDETIDVRSGAHLEVVLAPTRPPPTLGRLLLRTLPAGAELFVDDRGVGPGPWRGELIPGGHRVRARLRGHRESSAEVVLAPGQARELLVELPALPGPPPWYKRWYVWGGVAVLATAAGAGIYLATRPEEYSINAYVPAR